MSKKRVLLMGEAHYLNSGFAKREALRCGYDEAILLNLNGFVAEGPGENLFMVKKGNVFTPKPTGTF